jgi:hypothetical protein
MNLSIETLVKQLVCAALAIAFTVLSTQSVVRSSGLNSDTVIAQEVTATSSTAGPVSVLARHVAALWHRAG